MTTEEIIAKMSAFNQNNQQAEARAYLSDALGFDIHTIGRLLSGLKIIFDKGQLTAPAELATIGVVAEFPPMLAVAHAMLDDMVETMQVANKANETLGGAPLFPINQNLLDQEQVKKMHAALDAPVDEASAIMRVGKMVNDVVLIVTNHAPRQYQPKTLLPLRALLSKVSNAVSIACQLAGAGNVRTAQAILDLNAGLRRASIDGRWYNEQMHGEDMFFIMGPSAELGAHAMDESMAYIIANGSMEGFDNVRQLEWLNEELTRIGDHDAAEAGKAILANVRSAVQ